MAALRFAPVLVVVVVLQTELFSELRVFGVMPELLLGLTVAAGWVAGADRGAVAGFACGIVYDLFLSTPFALTALTYTVVGYGVGVLSGAVAVTSERGLRWAVSVSALAAGVLLFAVFGELLTDDDLFDRNLIRVALLAPVLTAPLMPVLHRGAGWAMTSTSAAAPSLRRSGMVK